MQKVPEDLVNQAEQQINNNEEAKVPNDNDLDIVMNPAY